MGQTRLKAAQFRAAFCTAGALCLADDDQSAEEQQIRENEKRYQLVERQQVAPTHGKRGLEKQRLRDTAELLGEIDIVKGSRMAEQYRAVGHEDASRHTLAAPERIVGTDEAPRINRQC